MKGRVLIIDSEPQIRRALTIGLKQHDYTAVAFPDGISAIQELGDSQRKGIAYDYLITDIFLPDINGLKILKAMKYCFPDLPVLVITAFGNERLKQAALSERNTGYLEKPFDIGELVASLEQFSAGATTLVSTVKTAGTKPPQANLESIAAYLMIRIIDADRSKDIFNAVCRMEEVQSCDAVLGNVDMVVTARAGSMEGINSFFEKVRSLPGVEVSSMSVVQRPGLDRDVEEFIAAYRQAVRESQLENIQVDNVGNSYIFIDIDRKALLKIFTIISFIDEVISCDVIEDGRRLAGMIASMGAIGKPHPVVKRIREIDGVLRVREAKVIQLVEK